MIKHGQEPYLECSSKGFKKFSAFVATIRKRGDKSIEEIYQAAKVFKDGTTGLSWRAAKGKKAINTVEVQKLYSILWDEYISENPELLGVLREASDYPIYLDNQVMHVKQLSFGELGTRGRGRDG